MNEALGEAADHWVGWHATTQTRRLLRIAAIFSAVLWIMAGTPLALIHATTPMLAVAGLTLGPLAVLAAVHHTIGARALPAARALIADLPFDGHAYLEALRSPPLRVPWFHVELVDVTIEVSFAGTPPLAAVGGRLAAVPYARCHPSGEHAVVIDGICGDDPWPRVRSVLTDVLGPIGGAHPIAALAIDVERRLEKEGGD